MQIGVPKQSQAGETRVALTPSAVERLAGEQIAVAVETGAGKAAHASDDAYEQAGATLVPSEGQARAGVWAESDVVLTVNPPSEAQIAAMQPGAVLIGLLDPVNQPALMQQCAERGVTAFAMEFLPRISRAQAMDVLSSQANIAGYKAMLLGADRAPKMMPMMITAAGTLAPAKVLVVGAGVAGLQAIATARRLGAVVEAYDVRPATKEQVQSLGARFIQLGNGDQNAETEGGYAKEQTEEEQARQREQMAKHVIAADVVVTTAAVFGKAPPMIIPQDVVDRMHPGSVIVDIAADPAHGRGNCEATRPGEVYATDRDVTIVGTLDLPTLLPVHASEVFANNMHAFLKPLIEEGELRLNMEDEVQQGAAIVHDGQIVNETVKEATTRE
jgi:NAD(P) transhydrogenase subunit alpha